VNYVTLVLIMLNILALGAVGYLVLQLSEVVEGSIQSVIRDEIRLQDDRIEKRVQRAKGHAADAEETEVDNLEPVAIRAGFPTRRR